MRKIEQELIAAIREGRAFKLSNTTYDPVEQEVRLHGNIIAMKVRGEWVFSLAGWNTPTTRSRINSIARAFGGSRVSQYQYEPVVDGKVIDVRAWF